VLPVRDEVFLFLSTFLIGDHQALLTANRPVHGDNPVDLGHFSGFLRAARLERFGHPRKTPGDVLGLGGLTWGLGEKRAPVDLIPSSTTETVAPVGIE
jgi:hypothetical protein